MRHLIPLGKVLFSALLLWWLSRSLGLAGLREAFSRLDTTTIILGLTLYGAQALVISWRWHRIVSLLGGQLPLPRAVRWVFVGLFFNQALPSSVGGDAVRVWLLHRDGTAQGVALSSVIVERGTGVVIIGLMVTACLPAVWSAIDVPTLRLALLAIGPALLCGLMLLAFVGPLLTARIARLASSPVASTMDAIRQIVGRPAAALEITALGALAGLLAFLVAYVLGRRLGIDLTAAGFVTLAGGAVLLSVLPISLGGWGLREVSMVALFGSVGVRAEDAVAMSIAYGILALAVALPGGVLWMRARSAGTSAANGFRGERGPA